MARTTVRGSQIRDDSVEIVDLSDFAVVAGIGLNVNFHAGRVRSNTTVTDVSAGSLLLSNDTTSYIEVDSTGTVSANTTGFTTGQIPLAIVVTSSGAISTITDKRTWLPITTSLTGDITSVGNATTLAKWLGGQVTYVPLTGDIQTYINNANTGDTLILASGTYTITAGLTISKMLHIMGQGEGITILTCSTDLTATPMLDFTTTDGSRISSMSIILSGAQTGEGFIVRYSAAIDISNIYFTATATGSSSVDRYTIQTNGAKIINVENCIFSATGTIGTHIAINGSSVFSTINIRNCLFFGSSGSASSGNIMARATTSSTINIYNSSFADTANKAHGLIEATNASAVINIYNSVINGSGAAAFDVLQTAGKLTLYNTTLVNNKTSGTITYAGNPWVAWTPTLVWGTADPASITQVGRYAIVNKTVHFTLYITSADGNAASSLTATLPLTPADVNSYSACASHQLVDATWTDPLAYIDQLDGTAGNRLLKFRNFAVCTDTKTCTFEISGRYEL